MDRAGQVSDGSYEAIVVGSGFAGAVTACRLAQSGFRVLILERGRRFSPGDFPALPDATSLLPDTTHWSWGYDHGLWDVVDLGKVRAVQAAGYGGGSLIYANVHLRAPEAALARWPRPFHRDRLDKYYDRVGAMLEVSPVPEAVRRAMPKARGLELAAERLGRRDDYFVTPLAVRFEGSRSIANRPRGHAGASRDCTMCGACCSGCDVGAKTSLDKNYLAVAEAHGAEVRTLAEVVRVEKSSENGGWIVRYDDHLAGGLSRAVAAPHVFLCAGAVHSTRLLLASGVGPRERVGAGYYANADAIAMVYDTRAPAHPTYGPTITGAIVHGAPPTGGNGPASWLMIQDGGYTEALHRAFGLLRAPALGHRNRFWKHDAALVRRGAFTAPPPLPARAAGLDRTSGSRSAPDALLAVLDDATLLDKAVPPQIRDFVAGLLAQAKAAQAGLVDRTVTGLSPYLADALAKSVLQSFGVASPNPRGVAYRLLRLVFRLIAWFQKRAFVHRALVDASLRSLSDSLGGGKSRATLTREAVALASGLALPGDPGAPEGLGPEHRMMLLAMGRDGEARHTLELGESGGLVATTRGGLEVYGESERLFRDVAAAFDGELRVNPLYSMQGEATTVHSQGGCPMSESPGEGVVSPSGLVHGEPGLYVMDAAIFPSPVGVNPSATIAAVAERNVEAFIANAGRALDWVAEADANGAAWRAWMGEIGAVLEPPVPTPKPPSSLPVALTFTEIMEGFVAPGGAAPESAADFYAYEAKGRDANRTVSVELEAHIDDVAAFTADPDHRVALRGRIVHPGAPAGAEIDGRGGVLSLMPRAAGSARTMRYDLRASSDGGATLVGLKYVHDDPGFDAWEDTTALFVELSAGGRIYYGVLRLSMSYFLETMLPSFRVHNTTDPSRHAWAIGAFAGFFFSSLQRAYLPFLNPIVDRLEVR